MSQRQASTRGNPILQQWKLLVGVAISAFFVYWLLRQVSDFGAVGSALREANYLYLLPALAAYFFGVWIRAARWHYLLRPLKAIPASRLFPVVVIGYMANDVLPARLGEFVRAYVLGEQEDLPKAAILGTIVVERTLDGIAMLLFVAAAALFLVPLDPQLQRVFQVAAVAFLGAIAVFLVVASSSQMALNLVELVTRPLPERMRIVVKALADRFLAGFHALRSPRLTLAALGLSIAAWLAEAAMYLLVGIGFGLSLPPGAYVLTTAFANLFAMIPSAPGYVGPFDAGAFASLALFGLSSNSVAAYVLVLHISLLVPVTVLGFYYLWRYGLSLRSLWSRSTRSEG